MSVFLCLFFCCLAAAALAFRHEIEGKVHPVAIIAIKLGEMMLVLGLGALAIVAWSLR